MKILKLFSGFLLIAGCTFNLNANVSSADIKDQNAFMVDSAKALQAANILMKYEASRRGFGPSSDLYEPITNSYIPSTSSSSDRTNLNSGKSPEDDRGQPCSACPVDPWKKELPQWVQDLQKKAFYFNYFCTQIIFWTSLGLTICGVIFAFWLVIWGKPGENKNEIAGSINGAFKIKGLAAIILGIILTYFFLYLKFVYPIIPISM